MPRRASHFLGQRPERGSVDSVGIQTGKTSMNIEI
jgi:hypothetical protein